MQIIGRFNNNALGIIIVLFLAIVLVSCGKSESTYTPVTKFDSTRNAMDDLNLAIVEAQKVNKNIILDVGGEWCIWCHRLDKFIEDHQELKDYLDKNFIVVKINYSPENKNEEFLSQFPQVAGYPHLFVLDTKGKLLHSQNTGDLELDKSYDAGEIMNFLKEWSM